MLNNEHLFWQDELSDDSAAPDTASAHDRAVLHTDNQLIDQNIHVRTCWALFSAH
jgi:hypothetical protein